MSQYVDMFLLTVPKKNLNAYKKLAHRYSAFILKSGAIEYREFLHDFKMKGCADWFSAIKVKSGEVIVTAITAYPSKAVRARAMKKMEKDPGMKQLMKEMEKYPLFDYKRMVYGGFKTIVKH